MKKALYGLLFVATMIATVALHALAEATIVSFDIAIGENAGVAIEMGSCNILIGDHVNVPSPNASYYINVDEKVYSNDVRSEQWFQDLVRSRSHDLINRMSEKYTLSDGRLRESHKEIDEMTFFVNECRSPAKQ